jgi:hypothetical protein
LNSRNACAEKVSLAPGKVNPDAQNFHSKKSDSLPKINSPPSRQKHQQASKQGKQESRKNPIPACLPSLFNLGALGVLAVL